MEKNLLDSLTEAFCVHSTGSKVDVKSLGLSGDHKFMDSFVVSWLHSLRGSRTVTGASEYVCDAFEEA
jgi:hypothetical protein